MRIYTYSAIDDLKGRTVSSIVLPYGEITNDYRRHRYLPGSLGHIGGQEVGLRDQHKGKRIITTANGLTLSDSPAELRMTAELPATPESDTVLEQIRANELTGVSAENVIYRAERTGEAIDIYNAWLKDIAFVASPDVPAFDSAGDLDLYSAEQPFFDLELYADGEGIEGEFAYDTDAIVSATEKVRKERIKPGAFRYAIEAPDREINLVLGDNSKPLASKKAGSLILEDTDTALKFKVEKLPRTSYTADLLGMLRAGTIVPGVVPFFSPTPASVAARLFADGLGAVLTEPEKGNPGVFRRIIRSGLLTALSILFCPPRGNPGAVTRIPRRLARPNTAQVDTINAVRPLAGDLVRNGRVIRRGVDIGPATMRRRLV